MERRSVFFSENLQNKKPDWLSWKNLGKAWTIVSIPLELLLLGHGIATKNGVEIALGAGGLLGDVVMWKWFNRDKNNQAKAEMREVKPERMVEERGSERVSNIVVFRARSYATVSQAA